MRSITEVVNEAFSVANLVVVRALLLALLVQGALKLFHSLI
jgi:hypothetical protein